MPMLNRDDFPNMRSDDRILVLKPIDGRATNSAGMVDTRLFKGDNQLHIIMDQRSRLWKLKFDSGVVPPQLKTSYTTFKDAFTATKRYYEKRNVEITEVID